MDEEQNARSFCACCGEALRYIDNAAPDNIHMSATTDALIERLADGRMTVLKGDCPLPEMMDLFWADRKYTIVQFLRCNECGNTIFWGLCVRGAPVYKIETAEAVNRWPWE